MTAITITNLDKWRACDRADDEKYSDINLEKLFHGKKSLTLIEVLHKSIPDEDKIWVATRVGVMTQKQTHAWLELVVTRVVKDHALNCGIESVERWARDWLSGKNRTEKAAEKAEARAAATWAAGAEAAEKATWAAGAAAATWAAGAEAAEAAEKAERKKQVSDLRKILKNE